ncbi:hypothetical protein COU61_03200 [Candidatus Pacearchaeota archaeon CG10_big_fil_rev_8_21_14_0_10_35_13]|nr:MAG: hypothetical protein COU61_03200 [Candidatus Pacearchaeota archaeon CG10_big_fil_rev_8_21_14_0_10_35_13]
MADNYENLITRIAEAAGITLEEINRRVEAKKAKLSGLISKEGAAQIVAAELGLSLDKQTVKINQIIPGMRRVNLTAKIIRQFPIREYNKNGREGRVLNLVIADETGNIKLVLWDTNHITLFEEKKLQQGEVIEITSGNLRNDEVHLTAFSDIKKSKEKLEVKEMPAGSNISIGTAPDKRIEQIKAGERARIRAVIVQSFQPRHYETCTECGKKVLQKEGSEDYECATHGKVTPKRRTLLNVVIDDGTETIRAVMFSDQIAKLLPEGKTPEEITQIDVEEIIIGQEKYFTGEVRTNSYFNNEEIIINGIEEIDLDKLIKELETRRG